MINIKRFVDRVSAQTNRGARDIVLPLAEAQMLRDEIMRLLADKITDMEAASTQPIEVTVKGGTW